MKKHTVNVRMSDEMKVLLDRVCGDGVFAVDCHDDLGGLAVTGYTKNSRPAASVTAAR